MARVVIAGFFHPHMSRPDRSAIEKGHQPISSWPSRPKMNTAYAFCRIAAAHQINALVVNTPLPDLDRRLTQI